MYFVRTQSKRFDVLMPVLRLRVSKSIRPSAQDEVFRAERSEVEALGSV